MKINNIQPDNTAVRTALWRALHVEIDPVPHIIEDETGLRLIAPEAGWRQRPDMDPVFTRRLRASMVARARFIEDLVEEQCRQGISQYVILGAGLDTFAQRRPDIMAQLKVYEIDQPDTQAWKQQRLRELELPIPSNLYFISVDFEEVSWWEELIKAGFDLRQPAVIACTGVSLYLTRDAIRDILQQVAALAPGSLLAMTFYLPAELMDEVDRPLHEIAEKGARAAGTPFISFFSRSEIQALAREAGFRKIEIVSSPELAQRYFADRTDQLYPASGEDFLLAFT